MFLVYDLYIPTQGEQYACWLMSPTIISCRGPESAEYQHKFQEKKAILEGDLSALLSEGLDPNHLPDIYQRLGLKHFEIDAGSSLPDQIQNALENRGPFIMVRPSLGADGIHAETILGILKGDEHNADKIVVLRGDTMTGTIGYYSVNDFKELMLTAKESPLTSGLNHFWHLQANVGHTDEIAKKDQRTCEELYSRAIKSIDPHHPKASHAYSSSSSLHGNPSSFFASGGEKKPLLEDSKKNTCCPCSDCCTIL